MPRLRGASFSTWTGVEKCPARVKYAKIDRLPDPIGPPGQRGLVVHGVLERYARGEAALTSELMRWRPQIDSVKARATHFYPELEVSLTRSWRRTSWERGRVRSKMDLVAFYGPDEAELVDYKTGREYPDHADQLELYATKLLHLYPKLVKVAAADWYLDAGAPQRHDARPTVVVRSVAAHTFHRDEHAQRLALWRDRFDALLDRTEWPAKRNPGCKHCPFNVRRGGPCKEGA